MTIVRYKRALDFALIAMLSLGLSACANASSGKATENGKKGCVAGKTAEKAESGLDQIILCIRSASKTHSFVVEMARTPAEQAQGLMFRTMLSDDKGMLFPFTDNRTASFWMKNTLIPLDIIFIRENGTIVNIAQNTTPYSLDPVSSEAPVKAVLELRGGLTKEMGIKPGDMVRWNGKKAKK
jgi:uncharacterized protein